MEFERMMEVEFLEHDELTVELEVRGLINPAISQEITNSLKKALSERLQDELITFYKSPQDQHEYAVSRPLQEVATCHEKLRDVQQHLMESIWAGRTVNEMLPRAYTKMLHVQGRMYRSLSCDAFGDMAGRLYEYRQFMWDMIDLLDEGSVSTYVVAKRLARVVIKIDLPTNEDAVSDEEVEENRGDEGSSIEVVEEDEMRDEVEEEIDEADVKASEEVSEEEEEEVDAKDEEEEVDKGKVDEEDEAENEMGNEDQVKCGKEQTKDEVADERSEDSVQVDFQILAPSDGIGSTEKGCRVVLMELTNQITGDSGRRARNSCGMLRRDVSARVRFKGLKCARVIAQLREWIKWLVARAHRPVDRLLGVLDLRLQDEVLAKASRRVGPEDV